jgi:chromosome segregation ATPase
MMNWRIVGWAAAAGAFLSAASWGWFESSRRAMIEEERASAQDRLREAVQTLADAQKDNDTFERQLDQIQTEQKDLSRRFVESELRHRAAEDSWLTNKNALLSQIEQFKDDLKSAKKKLDQVEERLVAEKEALQQEQVRRARTEAVLTAERDVTREATLRWRQERAAADELSRKQSDAIQNLQRDLTDLQTQLQRDQDTVKRLESDLSKTLNERDAAAVATQQTGVALDQAVADLQKRDYDVHTLQNMVVNLQGLLNATHRKNQQLIRQNQQLTRQVQQLLLQIKALQNRVPKPPVKPRPRPPAKKTATTKTQPEPVTKAQPEPVPEPKTETTKQPSAKPATK